MAKLDDLLAAHPILERVGKVRSRLVGLPAPFRDQLDAAAPTAAIPRLLLAMDHVEALVVTADRELVTELMVSRLDGGLVPLEALVGRLEAEVDAELAPEVDAATDQLLDATSTWVAALPITDDVARQLSEQVGSVAFERIARIYTDLEELSSKLAALAELPPAIVEQFNRTQAVGTQQVEERIALVTAEVEAVKTRVDNVIGQYETQFSAAQNDRATAFGTLTTDLQAKAAASLQDVEQRLPQLTAALDSLKTQVATAVTEYQTQFGAEQTQRATDHATSQKDIKTQAEATQAKISADAKMAADNLRAETEALMTELRDRRDQVLRLVGVVTEVATSGWWKKDADAQQRRADIWSIAAVVVGLIAVGFAAWAFRFEGSSASVGSSLQKVTVTIALGGVAAYCAQQSRGHRKREEDGRQRQLDLAAFGPFIAELTKEQQQALREAMAEKLFAREDAPSDKVTAEGQQVSLPIQAIIDALLKRSG